MNNKFHFLFLKKLIILFLGLFFSATAAAAPMLRVKTGFSNLKVTATGNAVDQQPLNSAVTFQPSVLWDVPSFSSRIGIHYLQELGSPYGNTTISGIGVSAYFYVYGISTLNSVDPDGTVIQKSRPGPYIFTSLTPVNFNLNHFEESNPGNKNFYVSGFVYDVSTGIGYDYPIARNLVLAAEYTIRNSSSGVSNSKDGGSMSYKGSTMYLTFATTYF